MVHSQTTQFVSGKSASARDPQFRAELISLWCLPNRIRILRSRRGGGVCSWSASGGTWVRATGPGLAMRSKNR